MKTGRLVFVRHRRHFMACACFCIKGPVSNPSHLMLLFLTLPHLSYNAVRAFSDLNVEQPDGSTACNNRTVWNIVWSCHTVVFSCVWVAIHPNFPSPDDDYYIKIIRPTLTVLLALFAPELLTMWALTQRLSADAVAKDFKGANVWFYHNLY